MKDDFKITLAFIMFINLGSAFAAEKPKSQKSRLENETTFNSSNEKKEIEQLKQKEEEDPLNEYHDPSFDTGNGNMTNRRVKWPIDQ